MCTFLAHETAVQRAPGIPCSLCVGGTMNLEITRADGAARMRKHAKPSLRAKRPVRRSLLVRRSSPSDEAVGDDGSNPSIGLPRRYARNHAKLAVQHVNRGTP